MENYPTREQMAITALMDEFVKLVNYQEEKPVFDDGMVALATDNTSPVYLSTQQVIALAEMLRDMSAANPERWASGNRSVYELAAKAEQNESDNREHLMHTMMGIFGYVVAAYGRYNSLNGSVNKEKDTLTIHLYDEFTNAYDVPGLARIAYIPQDTAGTTFYAVTDVMLRYTDDDCKLTFKAHPADTEMVTLPADEQSLFERKVWPDETELPADAVPTSLQKEIADYILTAIREDPGDAFPLRKTDGSRKWFAPSHGVTEVDGIPVPTACNTFTSCNILSVEVGTTGYMGGDTGHGGRTYLRITDEGSTDLRCRVEANDGEDYEAHRANRIEIMLGGDTELETFTQALRFAADVLEKKISGELDLVVPKDYQPIL
jgi:hypothetical protein